MSSIRSIRCTIFLQYLYFVAFCQEEFKNIEHNSLLLTKINDQYQLTKPTRYDDKTHTTFFKTPEAGKTYRFCPRHKKSDTISLRIIEEIKPNSETFEQKICQESIKAATAKVFNPKKLKNIDWNSEEMELFHSGFLLRNKFFARMKKKFNFSKITPDYGRLISKHKFVLQIEFYYNMQLGQTVAAEYDLLSLQIPQYFKKNTAIRKKKKLSSPHSYRPVPPIFLDFDSGKYIEHFRETLDEDWIQIFLSQSKKNPLFLLEFASCEHFALSVWSISCGLPLNYIPLWKIPAIMWIKVEIFARIVAKYLGDLKVKTGVTGTMTLSNKEVVDKNGFHMPKYLWKIFQFCEDEEAYGIIVILNCNPFERTIEKICQPTSCENNGWIISNLDYRTGEIYCCEMTNSNIENLKANYLSLKEHKIFDIGSLGKWAEKSVKIEEEYKNVISYL